MQKNDHGQQQNLDDAINTLKATEGAAAAAAGDQEQIRSADVAFNANGDPASSDNLSDAANAATAASDVDGALSEDLNPSEYMTELNAEIASLRGQLELAQADAARFKDQALRALAESENVRKRAAQDIDREKKFALEKFVRSLLPVYDALEKAVEMTDPEGEATKNTYEGVVNTLNLLAKEMQSFGVECVDPTGKPFDPNFHQAVSMVPSADVPANHVLNTMQKGFLLNGRVVRPAMVIVAKALDQV